GRRFSRPRGCFQTTAYSMLGSSGPSSSSTTALRADRMLYQRVGSNPVMESRTRPFPAVQVMLSTRAFEFVSFADRARGRRLDIEGSGYEGTRIIGFWRVKD